MLGLIWLKGAIGRRPIRVAAEALGLAVAVALVVAIGSFVVDAKRTMTLRSIEHVTVDWQVEAQPGSDPNAVATTVRETSAVRAVLPVDVAQTAGMSATTGASTQTTGPGVAVGLPPGYATQFPGVIRALTGTSDGVVVLQQTASNLHAVPGSTVVIQRAGLADVPVTVAGVVDMPQADSFFQLVGAPPNAQPHAPPDNVVLLPSDAWHAAFDPLASTRPDLVRHQLHARLDHALPGDPAAAYARVTAAAKNLEARASGGALVGDNLAATLDAARSDALYAQVLFLFLGIPGATLAVLIAATITAAGSEHRRRDAELLRVRGATPRAVAGLATLDALAIGCVATALGLVGGLLATRAAGGHATFNAGSVALAVAVAFLPPLAIIAAPRWLQPRRPDRPTGRRRTAGAGWVALLAVVLLILSWLVYARTTARGYSLVLAPEGVASLSVSYWAFAGPALLWIGAGLLAWSAAIALLVGGNRAVRVAVRPVAGRMASTAAADMRRHRSVIGRSVLLVALTIAFAASTAIFNDTYRQQSNVDAVLTNGGDVTVTAASRDGLRDSTVKELDAIAGVRHAEPLAHRFAYVGTDLQDLYGVDPSTIVNAARLQDAYFSGGSAQTLMAKLGTAPDGILVSAETVHDFDLHLGDKVTLRLESANGATPIPVEFHYIGVVNEFPTAPRDSFLVVNAHYLATATNNTAIDTVLLDTGGHGTSVVAQRAAGVVNTAGNVSDLSSTQQTVGSSLTAVDLHGLSRIELGFAFILVVIATGLLLALGIDERRRTLAVATALGARRRHVAGLVWSESAFVVIVGLLAGALLTWALSEMLVAVLTGVFDPPPASLAVPWSYLEWLVFAALVAVAVAAVVAVRAARQSPVTVLRASA